MLPGPLVHFGMRDLWGCDQQGSRLGTHCIEMSLPYVQSMYIYIYVYVCMYIYIYTMYRFLKKQVHFNILHQFIVPPHMPYFCMYTWNMKHKNPRLTIFNLKGATCPKRIALETSQASCFCCHSFTPFATQKRSIQTDQIKSIPTAKNLKDFLGKHIRIHHELFNPISLPGT